MNEGQKTKKDFLLPASIVLAALLVGGALIYNAGRQSGQPAAGGSEELTAAIGTKVNLEGVVFLGDAKAPIILVEVSDYQCPFCARFFEESFPLIKKNYVDTGKVKIVFQDFAFLGDESFGAAEAAWCAADQGKFWEYHDLLFAAEAKDNQENSGNLNADKFKELANQLKLNSQSFNQCLESRQHQQKVLDNVQKAKSAGVRATPTIFINDKKLEGALPYEFFKQAIEDELKK